jgi:hypothetical protein
MQSFSGLGYVRPAQLMLACCAGGLHSKIPMLHAFMDGNESGCTSWQARKMVPHKLFSLVYLLGIASFQ